MHDWTLFLCGAVSGLLLARLAILLVESTRRRKLPGAIWGFFFGEALPLANCVPESRDRFILACQRVRKIMKCLTMEKPKING